MQTSCGTPGYVAPEVLGNSTRGYDCAVDMWSAGVILYIMLCGFPPFYDDNNAKLFQAIRAGEYDFPAPYWDNVSEAAKAVVRGLLCVDVSKRLTAEELLSQPWVEQDSHEAHTNSLRETVYPELVKWNMRRKFKASTSEVE